MRTQLLLASLAAALTVAWMPLHGNVPGKAQLQVGEATIEIEYVAPAFKGRDIETAIRQPGANPWRLGADRPTTLTTPVPLQFGESTLPAGRYVLRAYFDDSDKWWLQAYDTSRSLIAQLPLSKSQSEEPADHLVIALDGSAKSAKVTIQWGQHLLSGDFSAAE